MTLKLEVIGSPSESYTIKQGLMVVGRSSSCDIVVDDPLASRCHAEILFEKQIAKIKSLNCNNPVLLKQICFQVMPELRGGLRNIFSLR